MVKICNRYKAILFDLDGVIVDTGRLYEECQKKILLKNNIDITNINWNIYRGFSGLEIFIDIQNKKNIVNLNPVELENQYRKSFLLSNFSNVRLFRRVKEILDFLKNKNVKIALVTSTRRDIVNRILEKFNLSIYFNIVTCAEDVNSKKPSPEPYKITAEKLGIKPSDCLVVEDSDSGVFSAIRAGIDCVRVFSIEDGLSGDKRTVRNFENHNELEIFFKKIY